MDMSKYVGSAFLSLKDVQDGPVRGKITAVEPGNYGRPVVTFTNGLKFSLNTTNNRTLMNAFGEESDDWVGEEIELYAGETRYQGALTPSVLARALAARKRKRRESPTIWTTISRSKHGSTGRAVRAALPAMFSGW
jgi:hypothetical protein